MAQRPLPRNAALAGRFDGNMKTAGRAVQQLVAEGLVIARPGMRAIPAPPQLRATKWAMTGRYARARAAQGLIFAGDVTGGVRKDTIVVQFIEEAGHVVTRTTNEIRARHANFSEQELFGIDANGIVIEHGHGTYGAEDEVLEAVINVRPALGNVITFDTYEAPIDNT